MNHEESFSFRKRLKSFRYAYEGIKTLFKTEHNAWIHITAAAAVVILGFILKLTRYEWIAIVLAIGMVFTAELVNTAIEQITNVLFPAYHKKAKAIKDLSAGAVLFSAFTAILIAMFVFIPKIYAML